ncbi:hypothetical protein HHI36_006561 [Cryptolaemus montrouzieri]|uniref:Reverse transcriptase domain-containing protein n=1 Tax=Cryptolaemus montrouzieri TaxID=559131 RepID=A0ABD2NXG4_9CUCU
MSKASDCVDISTLLLKLESYGIRDNQLSLLTDYLNNRRQKVVLDIDGMQYYSDEELVRRGVPQESIFRPLLFIVYINDLPTVISQLRSSKFSVGMIEYADDINAVITSHTMTSAIPISKNIANGI